MAVERKHQVGCNCCQAVLLAFASEIGLKWSAEGAARLLQEDGLEDALMALGSGFGAGMGSMEATCGALIGAGLVVGMLSDGKVPAVLKTRAMSTEFKSLVGALRCADIKGVQTKKVLCSCDNCVRYAVQIAEKYIDPK